MKRFIVLTLGLLLAGCVSVPDSHGVVGTVSAKPPAADTAPRVSVDSLRSTAYFTSGDEPLHLGLVVEAGKIIGYRRVDEGQADVTLSVEERNEKGTMVSLTSHSDHLIKLDLHISPDNERYLYTSTCPIIANGSAIEMWPHPIAWFAVSNLRSPDADAGMVCQ